MAEAVVCFVVENICNLLKQNPQILKGVISDQIQQVVDQFREIQPFFKDAESRRKDERICTWISDVRKLVYDAEDVIENFVVQAKSSKFGTTYGGLYRRKIVRDIKAIQKRMDGLTTNIRDYRIGSVAVAESSSSSYAAEGQGKLKRFYSHVIVEPQVVGMEDDVQRLVAHLVNECEDNAYRVVSICGMGGLGKTTLAKKIYNHSVIMTHFDALAWVSISHKLQLRNALQRIIFCIVHDEEERKKIMSLEHVKLVEYLFEIQETKKCLVVVDDIWTNEDWDCLKPAFPTQGFKSKLILTSRNVQLSKYVDPKAFLHQPQLLNEEQSWDLLRMRALPKGQFLKAIDVKEMEEFGREMVGHCGGLPLAIVVLGGILVTKPSWIEWKNVHQEIRSSVKSGKGMGEEHQRQVLEILALSYNDLPYQLKPCFLYLARFREDAEINTEILYQLWIAEGFVLSSDQRVEGETLVEVAESYLAELVHKSMVGVKFEEAQSSLRMFGSCGLHDLVRELALFKAKEEDSFNILDLRQGNTAKQHDLEFVGSAYTRRLDIYFDGCDVTNNKNVGLVKEASRSLRSVLWFNEGPRSAKHPLPILRLKLVNFRFLRVLSLQGFYVDDGRNLSQVLGSLINLRYLSLRETTMTSSISFMKNLVQLQTLDLRTRLFRLAWLRKDSMQKMGQLRHLYLPDVRDIKEGENNKLAFDGLSKLETLENFDTNWCQVKDLHKLTNLRKLTIIATSDALKEIYDYLESNASSCLRCTYLHITLVKGLGNDGTGTSLLKHLLWCDAYKINQLIIQGAIKVLPVLDTTVRVAQLLNCLSLSLTKLEEDPMPMLEKLPALRKLVLDWGSFRGKEMVCSATGFPQLELVILTGLSNLQKWKGDQGSMPKLTEITINHCLKLEELPEGLESITSLQSLSMWMVPRELCDKVQRGGSDFYKVAHVPSLRIRHIY